jgi:hypothetical protein
VCVVFDLADRDDPAAAFVAQLRRRARWRRQDDDTLSLELAPAVLEAVTGGELSFEVEHATAGAADCVWRLRRRDTHAHVLDTVDRSLCRRSL